MQNDNIDVVRATIAEWTRGDVDGALESFDSDVVWLMDDNWAEQTEYRGHAGGRAFVRAWEEPWDAFEIRLEQAMPAADGLATPHTFRGGMAGTDAWIE